MIGHPQPSPRTTWQALAFALVVFVAVDVAVFRSGLYAFVAKPDSNAGWMVRRTQLAATPTVPENGAAVLLLGDSRMGEGADERMLGERLADRHVVALHGAVPGSTPRVWPTLFSHVPAPRGGFDVVVVGLAAYDDDGEGEDFAKRSLDLAFLGPWLGLDLARELASDLDTHENPTAMRDVWLATFVKGFAWRRDVQDLAVDPWSRYRDVRSHLGRLRWGDPYRGVDRVGASDALETPQTGVDNAVYRRRWLGQLVRDVRATGADVLFVRMPRPFANAGTQSPIRPRVVDELARQPGVHVVDESSLAELDEPSFFFDSLHLNRRGRERFTELLAGLVERALDRREGRTK